MRSKEVQSLIDHMRETMREAPGVGLAAPQVGVDLQIAVIEDRKEYHQDIDPQHLAERERRPVHFHVIVNPTITLLGEQTLEFFEGCLSLPGFFALVPRARNVLVDCLNERGKPVRLEASGWYARILQHEIDHLNGALYVDRMRSRSFTSSQNFDRLWKGKPIDAVRKALHV